MISASATAPDSLSPTTPSDRPRLRVGLVQHRWRRADTPGGPNPGASAENLVDGPTFELAPYGAGHAATAVIK